MAGDRLVNGGKAWRAGRAGPAALAALEALPDGVARCRRILTSGSPALSAPAMVDAAAVLLSAPECRSLGLRAEERAAVVRRLGELVRDDRVADAAAVRAFRLILRATNRTECRNIDV